MSFTWKLQIWLVKKRNIEFFISGSDEQKIDEKGNVEIKALENDKIEEKNLFEMIDVVPMKPPKLKDVNFFELEKDETMSRAKKKKTSKKRNGKPYGEDTKDSSSDSFDNSEVTLKKIFDSYDPSRFILQPCAILLAVY